MGLRLRFGYNDRQTITGKSFCPIAAVAAPEAFRRARLADDNPAHRAYLHWIVYLRGIVLVIFGGVIHFAAPEPDLEYGGMAGVNRWAIAGVLVLLGAASLLRAAINRWTTEIAVTDRRVILKRGLITRDTIEINLPKVESVDVRQSILGRLLNYGTVIVRGTGGGLNPLSCVSAPLPLRRALQLPGQTSTSPA